MQPIQISPVLYAIAEGMDYFADRLPIDEAALVKGTAAFIRVVTIYLIAKGVILAFKGKR